MTDKRKRNNYRFREMCILYRGVLMILLVAVTALALYGFFSTRNSRMFESLYLQEQEYSSEVSKAWQPTVDKSMDNTNIVWGKYEALLKDSGKDPASWEYYTFSAYTSEDEGVDNISAIGLDIGKYSMYWNCAAVAKDSFIEYGDTMLVEQKDGSIEAWLAVDTGGGLEVGKEDKAEIDLYYVVDTIAAFDFGIQRMRVWVIKN